MAVVSFRLFCKNFGNLQEFFGQMDYRPPWHKIARTPMRSPVVVNVKISFGYGYRIGARRCAMIKYSLTVNIN